VAKGQRGKKTLLRDGRGAYYTQLRRGGGREVRIQNTARSKFSRARQKRSCGAEKSIYSGEDRPSKGTPKSDAKRSVMSKPGIHGKVSQTGKKKEKL